MNNVRPTMTDEVTITLTKRELLEVILFLTNTLDQSKLEYEHFADRHPILANCYERMCFQADKAGIPILDFLD